MKKLYWRPAKVSRRIHLFVALVAALGLMAVEGFKVQNKQRAFKEKMTAARIMRDGLNALRDYRRAQGVVFDPETDPMGSGMIGQLITPITTNSGSLEAKQTAINPNWAAVIVHFLVRAGVKEGDTVAIGLSGSFPGMNLAVVSAATAMKLNAIVVSSASSSQWGANDPNFTWLHMEKLLNERHIVPFRSIAASLGGGGDRGLGLSKEGKALLRSAVEESGLPLIYSKTPKGNLDERMDRYRAAAGDQPIVAYVNVGGSQVSVGSSVGKRLFKPGLNRRPPLRALDIDSVMTRFAREGLPIIHLRMIARMAKRYGLPVVPTTMPTLGEGKIFYRDEYNLWLAGGVLAILCLMLIAMLRMDIGHRLFHAGSANSRPQAPERMV